MGAYTGLPFITEEDRAFAQKEILEAAAKAMAAEGCPLSGVLYGGLMKTPDGVKVIEFNARFGDPETEVVLPLLESDIYELFSAVAEGRPAVQPVWRDAVTLGVVLATRGYPGSYQKGFEIKGLESVDAKVYHMGTKRDGDRLLTNGGRVLMVVAEGADIRAAYGKVYAEISKIACDSLFYRRDIAHWALDGRLLDGKALSASIKEDLRERIGKLEVKYGRKPSLAVIIVGNSQQRDPMIFNVQFPLP